MKKKPTISIILDLRKKFEDEKFRLALRVTFNQSPRSYSLKEYITKEDFGKLFQANIRNEKLKDLRFYCNDVLAKAQEIIDKLEVFSFESFKNELFPKNGKSYEELKRDENESISILFKEYITELKDEGRVSTYQSFETTLNSLQNFKKDLRWKDITVEFLKSFEKYMISNGRTSTTVGIYLRTLRVIYNLAITQKIVSVDTYPFSKRNYKIPKGRNIKKALTLEQIGKIFNYKTIEFSSEDLAKDLWIFSYVSSGINIKDICGLRYTDINNDMLSFIRAKTALTNKENLGKIEIYLNDRAKQIISKWGNIDKSGYIFDFFQEGFSPERKRLTVQNLVKLINKYMARISKESGIEIPVTTYSSRHSYSSVMKNSGASIEFISESLGHASVKTTSAYLSSFTDDTKKKYSDLLTNF